ncbi:3997_t:CDS:2 [Cetraspora pellucida]|uniref:3997_t:CDS:1 n=1 Tax=Cetraspora pellucida TaxID=1433469 RepID=A0A9N9E151_9GLOM|nr:3997_t:CDS:2 [Cetraspora pellucida]
MPNILNKQRDQINVSICYNIIYVHKWHDLIKTDINSTEISLWIKEQDIDIYQILFTSMIQDLASDKILQWFSDSKVNINNLLEEISAISILKSEQESQNQDEGNVNNPNIMKHKEHPSKRLKSSLKQGSKIKHQLNDHTNLNIQMNKQNNSLIKNLNIDIGNDLKGRKCGKCKQFGHYTKTCLNNIDM